MDANTALKLGRAYRAFESLSESLSKEMTIRQVLAMLYVASRQPVSQGQMTIDMDIPKSSMSRTLTTLTGQVGATKMDSAFDIFRVDLPVGDQRSREFTLTKEGEKVLTKLAKMLYE